MVWQFYVSATIVWMALFSRMPLRGAAAGGGAQLVLCVRGMPAKSYNITIGHNVIMTLWAEVNEWYSTSSITMMNACME